MRGGPDSGGLVCAPYAGRGRFRECRNPLTRCVVLISIQSEEKSDPSFSPCSTYKSIDCGSGAEGIRTPDLRCANVDPRFRGCSLVLEISVNEHILSY